MGTSVNVLVVEDESQWRGIYQRAAASLGTGRRVKVAANLADAERLIDEIRFAVAFVDIGLDRSDDRNLDGLQVMEKIRSIGDETSIVVVTGQSGPDAISIARDALKRYSALDILAKKDVALADIRKLMADGLTTYQQAVMPARTAAQEVLRGPVDSMIWDDQVMRATRFQGPADAFYSFLASLFSEYLPVVARNEGARASVDAETGLVSGAYWSRSIGAAVGVCFGPEESYADIAGKPRLEGELFGASSPGTLIREISGPGVRGGVFLLERLRRGDFSDSNQGINAG